MSESAAKAVLTSMCGVSHFHVCLAVSPEGGEAGKEEVLPHGSADEVALDYGLIRARVSSPVWQIQAKRNINTRLKPASSHFPHQVVHVV